MSFSVHRASAASTRSLPKEQNLLTQAIAAPHIESFNWFLEEGLEHLSRDLSVSFSHPLDSKEWRIAVTEVTVDAPQLPHAVHKEVSPFEARSAGVSYSGAMKMELQVTIGDEAHILKRNIGSMPIMVRSSKCVLAGLKPRELVAKKEEAGEWGGYFIVNGNERLVRLLVQSRANYPIVIERGANKKRGPLYSKFSCYMRCMRPDRTTQTVNVHYLTDGSATFRFSIKKSEYFLPVLLLAKALTPTTDREIYDALTMGAADSPWLTDRVEILMSSLGAVDVQTQNEALAYIGSKFRVLMKHYDASMSDIDIANAIIKDFIFVNLTSGQEKFDLLLHMTRKVYAAANGKIDLDMVDSAINMELLTPGPIIYAILREKISIYLHNIKDLVCKEKTSPQVEGLKKVMSRVGENFGQTVEAFVVTGNLSSVSGLDQSQVAGFSVTAEKLNYFRYLSHFQAVHRGAFFATVKTTAVRKLFPESWGFFCPVHTPDGAPCGLLNHLAQHCKVVPARADTSGVREIMVRVGMRAAGRGVVPLAGATMPVMLDGAVIGYVSSDPKQVSLMEATLRSIKVKGLGPPPARMARSEDIKAAKASREKLREALAAGLELPALECEKSATPYLPEDMEMVFVRPGIEGTLPHAGLYFFSTPGRMMRPVKNLSEGAMELIGTMEQVFLNIAVDERDVTDGVSTHMEGDPTTILSTVAALTPFSDYNQSPRNMYQCQMAKQTIGTPAQAIAHRSDNKAYRLQTPQSPLVRNKMHHVVDFDDYPHGANAVVAVLSYTGYDMEDAMIIKKGSFERGFAAASVYTCLPYDLVKLADAPALCAAMRFGNYLNPDDDPSSPGCVSGARVPGKKIVEALDDDGLPPVGLKLATGDPFLCYINDATGAVTLVRHKSVDPAVVDRVAVFGDRGTLNAADGKVRGLTGRPITASTGIRRVTVKLRYDRNPIIGDKFASRHGQKGVLSVFYPDADMPFTESGIQPDIIINPHAFPSRMTIGMLIESMAAKSGSLLGLHFDSTPFQFDEKDRAVDHFGQQLLKSGFNYYGNEPMYSGIHGTEMAADVFIGIVYYQRLRHMVSDKFQVRTHGPVDPCTHQPVKGRKKGGGVRFGEMERDSLIAHGASFLLQDRLLNCSDKHRMLACTLCGSVVSVLTLPAAHAGAPSEPTCRTCNSDAHVQLIQVPFVFKFMVNELISCNIKVELGVRQPKI